jgi:hypothetical protein
VSLRLLTLPPQTRPCPREKPLGFRAGEPMPPRIAQEALHLSRFLT